jgi:phage-related minor tail protein
MWEHLVGIGTLKAGLKVVNHLTGGACHGAVEMMEEITSSPAYTKYRIDQVQDNVTDFWDDHKEVVDNFFDNVGDAFSDTAQTIADHADDALDAIGEFFSSIF